MPQNSGNANVMIFIDAGFLKTNIGLEDDESISYEKFSNHLAKYSVSGERREPNLIRTFYYDGRPDIKDVDSVEDENKEAVRKKIEKALKKYEDNLEKIQDCDKLDIKHGHLIISKKDSSRQKGVDTLIAIDMITKAYENQYDYAILVAGDADFIPIVNAVKHAGPIVVLAYPRETTYSKELSHTVDRRLPLSKDDLIQKGIITKLLSK